MSAENDLRLLISFHRECGGHPKELHIGEGAAMALSNELEAKQDMLFNPPVPRKTADQFMAEIRRGEVYYMAARLVIDTCFPTPEQAKAIEGYRQVGPC